MKTLFSADAIGLTIILSVLLLGGCLVFLYQSFKGSKSGSWRQWQPGDAPGVKHFKENIAFYKIHVFKYAVALFVAWLIALFLVWNDYRPHNEFLDGKIPARTIDSTRMSAQDMIDLQTKK